MSQIRPPGVLDLVTCIRETEDEFVQALVAHYLRSLPNFSYRAAVAVARAVFSGDISLEAAIRACQVGPSERGRRLNAEVAAIVHEIGQERIATCHSLPPGRLDVRSDLAIPVRAPFYFVEKGRATLFFLQPRKTTMLTAEQLGTLTAVIRLVYARGDFEGVGLELLDCSQLPGSKSRQPRIYGFGDVPEMQEEELQACMARFARAFDRVCEMGITRPDDRPSKGDQPSGHDLFS